MVSTKFWREDSKPVSQYMICINYRGEQQINKKYGISNIYPYFAIEVCLDFRMRYKDIVI